MSSESSNTKRLETKRFETNRLETNRLETKRIETKKLETKRLETHPDKYLVGSMHRLRNGYGYGANVPTERNKATLRSVPTHRYPPEYSEPIPGSKPKLWLKHSEQSQKRCAQQILNQTSGEYGSYLIGAMTESVRLKLQPVEINPTTVR